MRVKEHSVGNRSNPIGSLRVVVAIGIDRFARLGFKIFEESAQLLSRSRRSRKRATIEVYGFDFAGISCFFDRRTEVVETKRSRLSFINCKKNSF